MTSAHRRPAGLALVVAMAGFLGMTAAPATASAPAAADFPERDSGYHNYPEMVAEIHDVEAAHPEIVDVFSIGESANGRDIWAAKVSDNVGTDEDEPEVLFDAAHHADEHLTVELALFLFHKLVDGYGIGTRVTRLVDTREVWIVFMLNPDGVQFDLTGDPYRDWRKNRQSNPTSSKVGIDLNRSYDYKWGCCGGSSGRPRSETYRGWEPFAPPETRALADFVESRVVGGRQQIRTHLSIHANGELILFPWGYTNRNLAGPMSRADRAAFKAMAFAMAETNGYRVLQSASWYITDGDAIDWMYGRQGIFSFTMEVYPALPIFNHYPADEKIERQTKRNREALLYLIDIADCPYRASGTEAEHCPPG